MHESVERALDEIDAAIFSGDPSEEDIKRFREFFSRFERGLMKHDFNHSLEFNNTIEGLRDDAIKATGVPKRFFEDSPESGAALRVKTGQPNKSNNPSD